MTAATLVLLAVLAAIGAAALLDAALDMLDAAHTRGLARLARARQDGRL